MSQTQLVEAPEEGRSYAASDRLIREWFDAHMRHFTAHEVACRCCDQVVFQPKALLMLDAMRKSFGAPVQCYSGTRCRKHNNRVGGAPQSKHLMGLAFDVAPSGTGRVRLLESGLRAGFIGIGLYPDRGFIHFDTGPERIWSA